MKLEWSQLPMNSPLLSLSAHSPGTEDYITRSIRITNRCIFPSPLSDFPQWRLKVTKRHTMFLLKHLCKHTMFLLKHLYSSTTSMWNCPASTWERPRWKPVSTVGGWSRMVTWIRGFIQTANKWDAVSKETEKNNWDEGGKKKERKC